LRPTERKIAAVYVFAAAITVAGCAGDSTRPIADYGEVKDVDALDIPPGLSQPGNRGLMEVPQVAAGAGAAVLPRPEKVHVGRAGNIRWLVVEAPAETVWPEVKSFFREQSLELKIERPTLGILETTWLENRVDVPTGFVHGTISKVLPGLYSVPTRDKFRARIERGAQPGTTEIYFTHYGIEQVDQGGDEPTWQRRGVDTALVNEMLNRLLVHLGVPDNRSPRLVEKAEERPEPRARLQGNSLVIEDPFGRAWRRVGVGLDRIGLVVRDRNRSKGLYYVRYMDSPDGWLVVDGEGNNSGPRDFRVRVSRGGAVTRVAIRAEEGSISPESTKRFLGRLRDELR